MSWPMPERARVTPWPAPPRSMARSAAAAPGRTSTSASARCSLVPARMSTSGLATSSAAARSAAAACWRAARERWAATSGPATGSAFRSSAWAGWRLRSSSVRPCGADPESAPAELRGDVAQDALDDVGVVVDAELVGDRQEQRVGGGDGRVGRQLPDESIRLRGVGPAEDGPRRLVDVADLVGLLLGAPEVGPVPIVDQGEDAAAYRDPRLSFVAGLRPSRAEGLDLLGLLDVERLAALVELEGRGHEVHAQ